MKVKMFKTKKAQEEMVGFAMIVVIVAVIILVFLGFMFMGDNENEIESYEINSFLDSMLEYTTECKDNYGSFISMRNLIKKCKNNQACSNNPDSCEVLEDTVDEILEVSWKTGEERPVKGYKINITDDSESIYSKKQGNSTMDIRTGFQDISSAELRLEVYY